MRGLPTLLAVIALTSAALAEQAPAVDEAPPLPGAAAPVEQQKSPAELRADQLDTLFAHLHRKGMPSDKVEERIWELWSASDSPTAEVLLAQSKRAIEDGAPAEALSILNRLIGANPDFAEAWNKRATLYFMMKKYDDALSDIAKVLDLEPRHFGALAGRGMILERQKKLSAAREAYEDALAVNPTLEDVKAAIKEIDRVEQGI